MTDDEIKKALTRYLENKSRAHAVGALVSAGLSARTAEQMADNNWVAKRFRSKTRKVLRNLLGLKAG